MTTPHERTRALRWGAELLRDLAAHPQAHAIDRAAATSVLHAYPGPEVVLRWIASNIDVIPADVARAVEEAGELLRALQFGGRCPAGLRRSLRFTLRHYPCPGETLLWADPRCGKPIGPWLLPEDVDSWRG